MLQNKKNNIYEDFQKDWEGGRGFLEDFRGFLEDLASKIFEMIEILPKIFKKLFYFYFRENLEKSTRSLLGPAQASSGRLGPTRASSFL